MTIFYRQSKQPTTYHIAVNTLYGLTSKKKIPYHKRKRGKKLYFKKDELDNWLIEGRQPTREEIQKLGLEKFQKRHQQ